MLLVIEEGIRGRITEESHGYARANNKFMKNYDKNEKSSFLMYSEANNLYGCPMTEKLPVGNFKWIKNTSKIDEEFIKNYDNNNDIGYFLKVDIEYLKEVHDLHIDLPFLMDTTSFCVQTRIKKCVVLIRNIKQALEHA